MRCCKCRCCSKCKMKCPGSPCPEVTLYLIGVIILAFGLGLTIVSIDPKPLPIQLWKSFLVGGLALTLVGGAFVILAVRIPTYHAKSFDICDQGVDTTVISSMGLLDDVQSVACANSPNVLRSATLQTVESVEAVRQCMMMQVDLNNSGILFYKETVI